jgi:hypothetical protein
LILVILGPGRQSRRLAAQTGGQLVKHPTRRTSAKAQGYTQGNSENLQNRGPKRAHHPGLDLPKGVTWAAKSMQTQRIIA